MTGIRVGQNYKITFDLQFTRAGWLWMAAKCVWAAMSGKKSTMFINTSCGSIDYNGKKLQ